MSDTAAVTGKPLCRIWTLTSVLFLLLGTVAAVAVIYYSLGIAREWLGQWNHATNGTIRRAVVPDSSLDATHRHPMD